MKQKQWKESTWIKGLRLVKSLRKSLLPEIEEKGIESVIKRLESES